MSDADAPVLRPSFDPCGKDTKSVKGPFGFAFYPATASEKTPERRPIGGRRPTVAVVDTGVAADHDWFLPTHDGAILLDATAQGWPGPSPQISDPEYTWHGTFVAGLVRKMAPDALILSVQLDRREGDKIGIRNGQILQSLTWLSNRTAAGPSSAFVDVICLAIGYREEPGEQDEHHTQQVKQVIRDLCRRGVLMVTAAGNRSDPLDIPGQPALHELPPCDTPVLPASLAANPDPPDGLPIIAVGANLPDGAPADFSPKEPWVKHREVGYNVSSTVPIVDPDVNPWWTDLIAKVTPGKPVEHFVRGFGRGSGTSFAAAKFAGRLAQAMLDDSEGPAGPHLADTRRDAAIARARRALDRADQQTR
jgi:subtilisin family serine protease